MSLSDTIQRLRCITYLIEICIVLLSADLPQTTSLTFPGHARQAPFCVKDDGPDVINFKPIFDHYNQNPKIFVPVSPDSHRSPTGFIRNITLSRISIHSIPEDHPNKVFQNFFHITIIASEFSEGLEGLYVQAIGAPLGVPIGEFVTHFDCGDCSYLTSSLNTAIVPCFFRPAASYLHPVVFTVGGKGTNHTKFHEAHFHFRYVDYPCFDVTFAQFMIIAVQKFEPLRFELFYSSLYKVNIEGVGAPYPFYYGWNASDVSCHSKSTRMKDNWNPQRNQRVKIKYSKEYDQCTVEDNVAQVLGPGIVCPPGPVTCGSKIINDRNVPKSYQEWQKLRSSYNIRANKNNGTDIFCYDCGKWEDNIEPGKWPRPPIVVEDSEDIETEEGVVPEKKPHKSRPKRPQQCEVRDGYGKNKTGGRDPSKNKKGCKNGSDEEFHIHYRLSHIGWNFGQLSLKIHGLLMIFTWTVATNCLIYCARFLKEATYIDKGSGVFGIGLWLGSHLIWTYAAVATMFGGMFMYSLVSNIEALCNVYDDAADTEFCIENETVHGTLGLVSVVLFLLAFSTGWTRPVTLSTLRNIIVAYHTYSGYLAKYLGLLCLLSVPSKSSKTTLWFIISSEIGFWLMFIVGTIIQRIIDSNLNIERRKSCPVPEAIDIFIEPPMQKIRLVLFPLHIVIQLGVFGGLMFVTLD